MSSIIDQIEHKTIQELYEDSIAFAKIAEIIEERNRKVKSK